MHFPFYYLFRRELLLLPLFPVFRAVSGRTRGRSEWIAAAQFEDAHMANNLSRRNLSLHIAAIAVSRTLIRTHPIRRVGDGRCL